MNAKYDTIGRDYRPFRMADPRVAKILHFALGDSTTVLNIGAGAGSYEPEHCDVIALEPSRIMLEQRLETLRHDLASSAWHERNAELLQLETMDYGYRVVVLRK